MAGKERARKEESIKKVWRSLILVMPKLMTHRGYGAGGRKETGEEKGAGWVLDGEK